MILQVEEGKLKGISKKSLTGKCYHAFLGIPYAKPPVGKLRFRPPQPAEKWSGILNAIKVGPPCIQMRSKGESHGSEDCLYLNVYTPTPPVNFAAPKAVMVSIPGGTFVTGSGGPDLYSPDYLMDYDVIVVTLNFRLHALGFLNMDTKNSANNCGLQDQCLALKWVKENIQHFGGDPKNITLMGNSSGATCVHYHMMSPKSKGLFHKAIIQSDPIECSLNEHEYDSRQLGFNLGRKLGFKNENPEKLVEFLRGLPAEEIAKNVPNPSERKDKRINLFHPCIEVGKADAFLPDTMENLRKTATPIPLIIGINNKEGKTAFSVCSHDLTQMLQDGFTKLLKRPKNMNDVDFQIMCDRIKRQYLGDEPMSNEMVDKFVDMFTDYFCRKLYESVDYIVKSDKPVYLYEFTYFGKYNVFEKTYYKPPRAAQSNGAAHADELPYLFYPSALLPNLKELCEPEKTVIKNLCTLWTNFAQTCDPTRNFEGLSWRRYTPESPCFLRINTDLELVEEKLREKEFAFWNELLK